MRVRVVNSEGGFEVADGQPVLDAALQASLNLPHSCRGGNCGLCRARLVRGEIHYPNGRPLGLTDAETASGYILLCQARARTDLDVELRETRAADEQEVLRLPCRIERASVAAPDVMIVQLRPPPAVEFKFKAGQYVDILLSDDRRRSFSIASAPHTARLLELHVRRVQDGEWTGRLFSTGGVPGALLTIEGPLGRFHYREASSAEAPLLLIGGGTGLAPLLSILLDLAEKRNGRQTFLYWGVRSARDLYAESAVRELASGASHLRYVPVLSEPDAAWSGRRGLVHAAVLEDIEDLSACDIYAAGPPAMIEALKTELPRRGARVERMFCDSFDYAPDSLARQRTSADTRS